MAHRQIAIPGSSARSILVVDDDAGIRGVLVEWIRALGYEVYAADDAESARDFLQTRHIDVALVDILMPGRDGVWLIRQIQQHFGDTAVVIVTGLTAMDPAVTLSPGVVGYLVKPFDFEHIARTIDDALASQSKHMTRLPVPAARLLPAGDGMR